MKQVLENNPYDKIRLISCGVKVFARQDGGVKEERTTQQSSESDQDHSAPASNAQLAVPAHRKSTFRFVNDGTLTVRPFVEAEGLVKADLKELRLLLESYYPRVSQFEEPFRGDMEKKCKDITFYTHILTEIPHSDRKLFDSISEGGIFWGKVRINS